MESLATLASTANMIASHKFIPWAPESAPAASSSGAEGTGSPACSMNTQANTSV
jgi:hypothetical protein